MDQFHNRFIIGFIDTVDHPSDHPLAVYTALQMELETDPGAIGQLFLP